MTSRSCLVMRGVRGRRCAPFVLPCQCHTSSFTIVTYPARVRQPTNASMPWGACRTHINCNKAGMISDTSKYKPRRSLLDYYYSKNHNLKCLVYKNPKLIINKETHTSLLCSINNQQRIFKWKRPFDFRLYVWRC